MKTIYLCDDDPAVRGALAFLLQQHDMEVFAFERGADLLAAVDAAPAPVRGVFLLDMRMEPMGGEEVHQALIARGLHARNPVLFLSGHGSIPMAVASVQRGAVDFLEKPYTDDSLIERLGRAFALEAQWQAEARRREFLASMWQEVTPQQRRVALLVAAGDLNKVIAAKLEVSERMVEVHRARVFEKLGVDSAAELATTLANMRALAIALEG
ncbi:response regulator transcription factor [Ramlibacter sp. MAHUQ-53]|uniref:response regulator transcription factor n=1 Tax=unclassified Ramlibacter TaxID=2617605 RepID=UPI003629F443